MKKIIAVGIAFAPAFAFAQTGISGGVGDITQTVSFLASALSIATGLILTAAIVYFLFGVFQYIRAGGDEEGKSDGRKKIISGIIGIAVMVSVWGLVNFFTSSAGLRGGVQNAPVLPEIRG